MLGMWWDVNGAAASVAGCWQGWRMPSRPPRDPCPRPLPDPLPDPLRWVVGRSHDPSPHSILRNRRQDLYYYL
eukprot:756800-Prorocentrum_minimum.AAC.1